MWILFSNSLVFIFLVTDITSGDPLRAKRDANKKPVFTCKNLESMYPDVFHTSYVYQHNGRIVSGGDAKSVVINITFMDSCVKDQGYNTCKRGKMYRIYSNLLWTKIFRQDI